MIILQKIADLTILFFLVIILLALPSWIETLL